MRAKPIIIIFSILLLVTVVAIVVRSRSIAKPQTSEVFQFLDQFNANLQGGNVDSLNNFLETNQHGKITVKRQLKVDR